MRAALAGARGMFLCTGYQDMAGTLACPLHDRLPAQIAKRPELGRGGVRVVEFLPGQLRAAEEQVVVRITDAQVRAGHVA